MSVKTRIALRFLSGAVGVLGLMAGIIIPGGVASAEPTVPLGTAATFAVLAGTGITNTGSTVLVGDVGTCPTPATTGFPPGVVVGGTNHGNDAAACAAKADLLASYNDAAARTPTIAYAVPTDLGGMTLVSGVYSSPSSLALTGTLILDAGGNPDAAFVFQAGSTVVTASNSHVVLINGAQACNVFWQVGSSATLGTGTTFVGSILALTSITATTNATVEGRLLARNGATTLDTNVVNVPTCAAAVPPTTTTTTAAGAEPTTTTTSTGGAPTTTTTSTLALPTTPTSVALTGTPGLTTATTGQGVPVTPPVNFDRPPGLPETGVAVTRLVLIGLAVLGLGFATRRTARHAA